MLSSQTINISPAELQQLLEPLIRRVVREELDRVMAANPNIFYLDADMPLYADMEEIAQRKIRDEIHLYSHDEVWHE